MAKNDMTEALESANSAYYKFDKGVRRYCMLNGTVTVGVHIVAMVALLWKNIQWKYRK